MSKVKVFTGFAFVAKPPKKKTYDKRYTNIAYCVCQLIDGKYVAAVNLKEDNQIMDFTPKSYDLKNRLIVFTKKLDKNGKPISIYRSELEARHSPGIPRQYTPFCENYVYSGYIVKKDGKHYFDMKDLVGPYSVNAHLVNKKLLLYEDK